MQHHHEPDAGLLHSPCLSVPTGGFPVVLDNLWLGAEEGQAVASALVPKLQKTKVAVEQLLFEVATLEVRDAVLSNVIQACRQDITAGSQEQVN